MFKFFSSKKPQGTSKSKKANTRSLRFESLEEKVVLSVSPLPLDGDPTLWPVQGSYLEEIRQADEAVEASCYTDAIIEVMGSTDASLRADIIQKRVKSSLQDSPVDLEKLEQLKEEGRLTREVERVTWDGTVVKETILTEEAEKAMGLITLYETPADNSEDANASEKPTEFSLSTALLQERAKSSSQETPVDFEKIEQLRKEGRLTREVERVTWDGTVVKETVLTEEAEKIMGPITPYMTSVDSPINHVVTPSSGQYSGVAMVAIKSGSDYYLNGTGTLLTTGTDILTSAHLFCNDNGVQTLFSNDIAVIFNTSSGTVVYDVVDISIHNEYSSSGSASNSDIAIIRLATSAVSAGISRYDIYRGSAELYSTFTKVGYGYHGTAEEGCFENGNPKKPYVDGNKRSGKNTYDYTPNSKLLYFDIDNGTPSRDLIGSLYGYAHYGLGDDEIMTSYGDSGGPGFITVNGNTVIAGVTMGGRRVAGYDIDSLTNSTYGELGVDVRVSYFADWIDAHTSSDVGETMSTATSISPFTNNSYSKAERIGNGSYGTKDVDMYKLVVSSSDLGRTYTFTTSFPGGAVGNQSLDTYIRLFDSNGTVLGYDDDGGNGRYSKLMFTPATVGTYYLGVSAYGNQTYNPSTANSGTAGSTGVYKLQVDRSPATPTGLAATPVANYSSQIKLTWTATSGATNYTVQRSPNGTSLWTTLTSTCTTNSYTSSGLSADTPYYYRILAKNSFGNSSYSAVVSARTNPAAPSVPTNLVATPVANTTNQIKLTWTATSGATSYTVQRSTDGIKWTNSAPPTSNSYTYSSLSPNTTYYFHVRANNSGGSSAYSTPVSAKTNAAAPSAPTASAISSSRIRVSWDEVSGATGYTLERSTTGTGNWAAIYTGPARFFADIGLSANTTYHYRLKATSSSGTSGYSNTGYVATKLITPVGLSTSVTSVSRVNLTWNAVSGATGYALERSTTGSGNWVPVYTGSGTSYLNTGLSANTKYYYRIKATTSTNQSSYAANVSATTFSRAPTGLLASASSSSRIKVDWDAVPGATGYTLQRSSNGVNGWSTIYSGINTSYANTNLSAQTTYYYRVSVTTSSNTSIYSSNAPGLTKLATPANFTATSTLPSRVTLSWGYVSGAGSYILESSTDLSSWTPTSTGAGAGYTFSGLDTNTKYYYRVKATSSSNSSDFSNTIAFKNGQIELLPTAIIENADSLSVHEGLNLQIYASGIDPHGQGLTYLWDLSGTGNGNFVEYTTNSVWFSAENLNGYPGSTRTIRLKVRDANGLESPIVETVVSIIDDAPSLAYSITYPYVGNLIAGEFTEWKFTAYDMRTDPIMNWVVRWGDGYETVVSGGPRNSITLDHIFRASGNLEITILTTDIDGINLSFSFFVFVQASDLV